ncbi:FAD-binding monooxygenase [Citricoccus sp. NR2]|uniref:FAD-binding monooxygenase n=1 Tax=Citricoccus sp. NR2 TaxID=3004095 RepID=UPI0022DD70B8|nr:FAD-binding monooxygenase [Citricoccus sp. NR2]WBL20150.1 FAD-binding monooxygenase [Citricoccus sp. NR2]
MHFHHQGYVSTDPRIKPAAGTGLDRPEELPDEMDVLIVGTGPGGMSTAATLAAYPEVHTRIIDRRPHRLEIGQADGIQARSVETFQAFGFAERIISEAYWLTEMNFWKPNPENPREIYRSARTPDDPEGVSEFPHLIVNQARVLDYFAEAAYNAPTRLTPDFGYEFVSLEIDRSQEYPVAATLRCTAGEREGEERVVRTKYLVGADGARSKVRDGIGRKAIGDVANHAWGVLDILADTDFPDIRTKCAIQSHDGGSILLIPREGGHLFRLYVDLGEVSQDDNRAVRNTPHDEIVARANKIMHPYTVEVKETAWWSVYEVGHRVTDKFDDVAEGEEDTVTPRVFITGDACHTHSAKAGQGMNVSMQDGFNVGWKLGQVLSGLSAESLLHTYSGERQEIAQNLIDFDKEWSSLMAAKPEDLPEPSYLEDFYMKTAEFPAGFMTEYKPSELTLGTEHQELATGFPVGKRFKSARVARVSDTNPLHLGHLAEADGRWRIYVFADAPAPTEDSQVNDLARWLAEDPASPVAKYTRAGTDDDSLFDLKVIYQQSHHDLQTTDVPEVFRPRVGPFRLENRNKIFGTLADDDIFEARGISRDGAIVVVRPDQYVSAVLPLSAHDELARFFDGVLVEG